MAESTKTVLRKNAIISGLTLLSGIIKKAISKRPLIQISPRNKIFQCFRDEVGGKKLIIVSIKATLEARLNTGRDLPTQVTLSGQRYWNPIPQ